MEDSLGGTMAEKQQRVDEMHDSLKQIAQQASLSLSPILALCAPPVVAHSFLPTKGCDWDCGDDAVHFHPLGSHGRRQARRMRTR